MLSTAIIRSAGVTEGIIRKWAKGRRSEVN